MSPRTLHMLDEEDHRISNISQHFIKRANIAHLIGRYLNRGTVEHLIIFDSELVGSFWTVSVYKRLSWTKKPNSTACLK